MMNKIKLFSWLKLWHNSKSSTSGDNNSSPLSSTAGEQPGRHAVGSKYGKKEWMRNWSLLHIDKRSCAQTKDVYTVNQQQQQGGRCRSQLESASDHLAQSAGILSDHAAHISIRSSSLDLDEKGKESHSVVILLGHHKHHHPHEGIALMETLRASAIDDTAKRDATALDVATATPAGLDMAHKCGLKNRVLPLTTREHAVVLDNTAPSTPVTHPGDHTGVCFSDDVSKGSEDGPFSLRRIVTRPDAIRRTGSLSLKKLHSAKVSLTDSPKSPRDIKWKKLLSYSRSSSPRSPSCLSQQGEPWSREQKGSAHHQKGSYSTMGSPWNSQAGGNRGRRHSQRRSSFKSSENQGQWITTDSDFVVLEL